MQQRSCLRVAAATFQLVLVHIRLCCCASLQSNNFSQAPLPDDIGLLKNLTTLDVRVSRFSGPLPSACSSLTKLKWLSMGYLTASNNTAGYKIPASWSAMSSLSYMRCDACKLNMTLGELPDMPALKELMVYNNNNLRGTLPASECTSLPL